MRFQAFAIYADRKCLAGKRCVLGDLYLGDHFLLHFACGKSTLYPMHEHDGRVSNGSVCFDLTPHVNIYAYAMHSLSCYGKLRAATINEQHK